MEHTPQLRRQLDPTEKTIILVGGNGKDGKTTTCSKMINENTGYISFDQIIWENDLDIFELQKLKRQSNHRYMVPIAFTHVDSNYEKFFKYTIQKINSINKDIILIDSFFFTKEEFYKRFYSDLRKTFRVWEMKRI